MTALKNKATELWDAIVLLETEKYDLEERSKRQDYDVSSLSNQLPHQKLMKFSFLIF